MRRRLFDIIDALQPAVLTEEFRPPRKKKITLEMLLKDSPTKKKILAKVDRLMHELLTKVVDHDYAVSWDVERKVFSKRFSGYTQ